MQDRRCTYNVTLWHVRVTIVESGQAIIITYCEFVCVCVCVFVALGIQRAMRIAPYCHLWPAPIYNIFSTLSHKRHDFRKEKKMRVLIFSTGFVRNISCSKKN